MTGWAARLFARERDLRMAWEVEWRGRRSVLVGAAHFFPYRFRSPLRAHVRAARVVVLETPLDAAARSKVIAAGSGRRGASLYDALGAATRRRIEELLETDAPVSAASRLYWELLRGGAEGHGAELRRLEPWMAFFHIWTELRRHDGWHYSVDLEIARLASGLGRDVCYLESIEEQIDALSRVPLQRFVDFLERADWEAYRRDYVRHYLRGDVDALTELARTFPTFCDPVIGERGPLLAERMAPYLDQGGAVVCVGILHCRGLIALLRERGYTVARPRELEGRMS
jgi:hypothetical protein